MVGRSNHVKEMGGEASNKGLEVGADVGRDTFSRGTTGGDNGAAGVVYLRK